MVSERTGRRRDVLWAALIWVVLTAVGEWWAFTADIYPLRASREADIIDGAFRFLMILGTPVFTFVVAVLVYSVLRFRAAGPDRDAEPVFTHRRFVWGWLLVTSALAVYVIFNPGLSGLAELAAEPDADLTVEVEAEQWKWHYTYVDHDLEVEDADELVLPVGRRVRFRVTSRDVIHSFWVPAFRVKADAVPGRTAEVLVTPTMTGATDVDAAFRVQCAEMCGTGHPRMRTDVRVVSGEEFDAWVDETVAAQGGGG